MSEDLRGRRGGRPAAAPPVASAARPHSDAGDRRRARDLVLGLVEVWTNRLWFDSLGYGGVFTTMFWTTARALLRLRRGPRGSRPSATRSSRSAPGRSCIGDGYRNPTVERYQDTIDPIRQWVLVGVGSLMFVFGGASAAGHWKTYLLWRNGEPFGQDDVYFHRDIGFFVFGYPWYRYVVSFAFTLLIVIAAGHGRHPLPLRRHPAPGAATTACPLAAQVQISVLRRHVHARSRRSSYWLDRYGLAISSGHLFTGISYTDAHAVLPAKNILAVIAVICALLFFGNVIRPGWMLPVARARAADPVGDPDRRHLAGDRAAVPGPAVRARQGAPVHRDEHRGHAAGLRHRPMSTHADYCRHGDDSAEQLKSKAEALPGVRLIDPQLVVAGVRAAAAAARVLLDARRPRCRPLHTRRCHRVRRTS